MDVSFGSMSAEGALGALHVQSMTSDILLASGYVRDASRTPGGSRVGKRRISHGGHHWAR